MELRLDNASLAFNRISMPARAFETGQFSLALAACFWNVASSMPGNVRRRFEFDPSDGKSLTDLFEGHACPRLKMSGRETSARKLRGQRHCKAPGMGRAEQLFRVGSRLPVL